MYVHKNAIVVAHAIHLNNKCALGSLRHVCGVVATVRVTTRARQAAAPSKQRAEYTSTILVVDGRVSGERYHMYC